MTWTFTNKSSGAISEIDFVFSDSSDFLFSDGDDFVFVEGTGEIVWNNLTKHSSTWSNSSKNTASWAYSSKN